MSETRTIQDSLQRAWVLCLRPEFGKARDCLEKARTLYQIEDFVFFGRIAHTGRQIVLDQDQGELAAA